MNMNIQNLVREAQKVQKNLEKTQKELENTKYEGNSSLITIVLNGKKEVCSIKIDAEELEKDDIELLEDMIMVAFNDASKKVDADKDKKLSKYGQGLAGLM